MDAFKIPYSNQRNLTEGFLYEALIKYLKVKQRPLYLDFDHSIRHRDNAVVVLSPEESSYEEYSEYAPCMILLDEEDNCRLHNKNTFESFNENVSKYMNEKYGTPNYELYFSWEVSRFTIIPKYDELSSENKLKLFTKYVSIVDMIILHVSNGGEEKVRGVFGEDFRKYMFDMKYTPLWINTKDDTDIFQDIKTDSLNKIETEGLTLRSAPEYNNILDIIKNGTKLMIEEQASYINPSIPIKNSFRKGVMTWRFANSLYFCE